MAPKPKAKFLSKKSIVTAVDASGQVFKGFNVWVRLPKPEPNTLFKKCLVMPGSTKDVLKCRDIEPPSDDVVDFDQNDVYNLNQNLDVFSFHDIGTLPHTNVACVLDFINQRLQNNQIYSTADPLLVAVNPFKDVGLCTDAKIDEYRDAVDVSRLPPHVFALARRALENFHGVKKSQTIIVSGESGAGKTEATKHVMRFFAAAKSGSVDLRIQNAVLAANPILEAFGNAKTLRNNNSSRFGRFVMLDVSATGGIKFGSVKNFLLEKSRILKQENEERNYHIFYQLLKAAPADMKTRFHLKTLNDYSFINPSCLDVAGVNDFEEWADVVTAFEKIGMSPDETESTISVVAGILLMGNVKLNGRERDGVPDAGEIDPESMDDFTKACQLLFLDPKKTEEGLIVKIAFAGGKEIRGLWTKKDCIMLKDSLCKAVYDKLFFWIVVKLNTNIEPPEWKQFMGMLDIFGFEVFQNNSLEQLFINITNEMLQKNFTDVVFDKEIKLYKDEGISSADVVFTTNDPVIKMLTDKKCSLMAALDDQCLAPSGNDEKFLSAAYQMLKDNEKLIRPKVAGNVTFLVDHTIGEISYRCEGFLLKNKDVLRPDLIEVVQSSENCVTGKLFEGMVVERGKMKGQYIGAQFLAQLESLMTLINSTEPHFIRCVKPNEVKKPLVFDQGKVIMQLHSLSILEALQLRNLGFSYRRPFEDFIFQFKFVDLGASQDPNLSKRDAAERLINSAKLAGGWQIGKTMIFMKSETAKELVTKQREALASWGPVCAVIEAYFLRTYYVKASNKIEGHIVRMQALARRKLVGQVAAPAPGAGLKSW